MRLTAAEKKLADALDAGATVSRDRKSILVCDIPESYIARASTWESLCSKRPEFAFTARENSGLKGYERRAACSATEAPSLADHIHDTYADQLEDESKGKENA